MDRSGGFVVILFFMCHVYYASGYFVTLSCNGPVVLGANITFKAELFNSYGEPPSGTFIFLWKDNAIPYHEGQVRDTGTVAHWNVSYQYPYAPGTYEMEVIVERHILVSVAVTSQRITYNITAMFNGQVKLEQHSNKIIDKYISNSEQTTNMIELNGPDLALITQNATSVLTYWFVDCVYYGYSTNFTFFFNYTETKVYSIEALVVASYDQPITTTVAPSTTTASPTTTSTVAPNNSSSSATTPVPVPTADSSNITTKGSNDVTTTPAPIPDINGLFGRNVSVQLPYVCLNNSLISPDRFKTYGYFRKQVAVKAPVNIIAVTGNNWLQPGDMLNMQLTCNGSSQFYHCMKIIPGTYNVTGDETCVSELQTDECLVDVVHYFREPCTYTVLVIIRNDVSKIERSIVVNMYEVTKQPQLSVIVVPVACSMMAVILIVFGVAYYLQSQNRYTVEVADFDFGQVNDMEYKTFRERLRDGMSNVLHRPNEIPEHDSSWPPRRKFDNEE